MSFKSWLTGRDDKEADVYANFDKVDEVVTNIKNIQTNEVEAARDAVAEAINELNNVNGVSQYVGSVSVHGFDGVFDSIGSSVAQIAEQLQSKADDIKEYEESAWYEKLGSTFAMVTAKATEGVLSVLEDIGDGVVSIVGWVAPKDSGVENWCKSFVEKEWSHDAFNFYYNSEFAKKSAITEDSGAASAFKVAGAVAGTVVLTAATMGAGAALSGAATAGKIVGVAGKVAGVAGAVMQSGLAVSTGIAALSGMGSGTEAALKQGLDFDAAAGKGAVQGAAQGAMAYAGGKIALGIADKAASGELATLKAAAEAGDDAAKAAYQQALQKSVYAGGRLSGKAYETGYNSMNNVIEQGVIKGTLKNATSAVGAVASGVKETASSVATGAKNTFNAVKEGTLLTNARDGLANAGSTIAKTVTHPIDAAKTIVGAVGETVVSPAGVAALNATGREVVEQASQTFEVNDAVINAREASTPNEESVAMKAVVDYTPGREAILQVNQNNNDSNDSPNPGGNTQNAASSEDARGQSNGSGGNSGGGSYINSAEETFTQQGQDNQTEVTPQEHPAPSVELPSTEPTNTTPSSNEYTPSVELPSTEPTNTTPEPVGITVPENTGETTISAGTSGLEEVVHSGGEYNATSGYTPMGESLAEEESLESILGESATSIEEIIKGNQYSKIPTSTAPITSSTGSSGTSVVPIVSGLSAASAAGIGAKAYIDKKQQEKEQDEEDDFDTETWSNVVENNEMKEEVPEETEHFDFKGAIAE